MSVVPSLVSLHQEAASTMARCTSPLTMNKHVCTAPAVHCIACNVLESILGAMPRLRRPCPEATEAMTVRRPSGERTPSLQA